MSTLTTAPLAPLLSTLFQQAAGRSPALAALFRDVPDEEQNRLMQSKTDYRELYHRLKDFPWRCRRKPAHCCTCWRAVVGRKTSSNSARRSVFQRCTWPPRCATTAAAG
ncbi:hypothetical protein QEP77_10465 [Serratia sp. B1]|nr:hypothetical protein QEP77_10465 [Serratia sp. B1]